ncbi:hypothetical protein NUW54_g1015 [Trametes sanguinea]|uniref:Uncharacterized protein n=1 Tax=Trametes sanguinea TaxID=158606 RepID=A0ACC1QBC1_9APHY|nr:hypothetical protein NUW54_g1015 [Trametes sanguinea]
MFFIPGGNKHISTGRLGSAFQRSNETVSRSFRAVLDALLAPGFRGVYMKLPDNDTVPLQILHNPKLYPLYPFFKDCRGAIDGSHLYVNPPALTRGRWRDRDGNLTQNMLAICNFNMFFTFVMVGWEGSIADSTLYDRAVQTGGLTIGEGLYWIADAGFASCSTLLVPYRNTRYHLREWAAGNRRPQNKEELYNLRHAQLRNIIERIFGVLKREFKMAREACEYSIQVQCCIPFGLTLLHNFFRTHNTDRHLDETHIRLRDEPAREVHGDAQPEGCTTIPRSEDEAASQRREGIAMRMWEQYQNELAERCAHEQGE